MKKITFLKHYLCVFLFVSLFTPQLKADIGYAEFKTINSGMNALETVIGTNSITIETWIYIDNAAGFFASNMHNDKGFLLGFDGWFKFQLDGNAVWINPTTWIGKWTHIACVADGTNMIVYVNGESVGTATSSGYNLDADNKPMYLGRAPWGNAFKGKLADFRLWNVAKTATDIQNNYKKQVSKTSPGLIKNYYFNEGIGDSAEDVVNPSGNRGWFMGTLNTDYAWGVVAKTPSNLNYAPVSNNELNFTWESSTNLNNKWTIEVTDPNNNITLIENVSEKTANIKEMINGRYEFRVKEISFMETELSDCMEVNIPLLTSVSNAQSQNLKSKLIQKDNHIVINRDSNSECVLLVYNTTGQLKLNKVSVENKLDLDISSWNKEIYIVKLYENGFYTTWKVIR